MHLCKALLIGLLFATTAFAQQTASDVVSNLRNRYKAECAQLDASEASVKTQLAAAYTKELTRSRDVAQAKGDLDAVIQINGLITAASTGAIEVPPKTAALPLRAAYTNYERNLKSAIKPLSSRRQLLDANLSRELGTLEQQYTRSGLIEAAKLAREVRIEVAKRISDAKEYTAINTDAEVISEMSGAVLTSGGSRISTKSYKAPVEVEWRLETNGDFRIAYACKQIALNYHNTSELCIEGGPVEGWQSKKDSGETPLNQLISVKLNVQPTKMTLFVDGKERAMWKGDFSNINQPVGIMNVHDSTVKVKQVIVRKIK